MLDPVKITQQMELTLAHAKQAGVDFAECFVERCEAANFVSTKSNCEPPEMRHWQGLGLRLIDGERVGYVCTTDVSPAGFKQALSNALTIAGKKPPLAGYTAASGFALPPLCNYAETKNKYTWETQRPTVAFVVEKIAALSEDLRRGVAHLTSWTTGFSSTFQEVYVGSTDGVFGYDIRLNQLLRMLLTCADGSHRSEIGDRIGCTSRPAFLATVDHGIMMTNLKESAAAMRNSWQRLPARRRCGTAQRGPS